MTKNKAHSHAHAGGHVQHHAHDGQPKLPHSPKKKRDSLGKKILIGFAYSLWVIAVFILAQLLVFAVVWLVAQIGLSLPFVLNDTALQTSISVIVYAVAIALAIFVPWKVLRQKLRWGDIGLAQSLPSWRDIGLAPIAFVVSLIATGIVMYIAGAVLPGVDLTTEQQVGFENITQRYEMLLAFFTLVVLAPICEEVLFRGYLYGRVRRHYNALWTIALTSFVFGLMHVYAGPGMPLQWNVMIGTTVLALFIGALREYTGSIWAGILVHMLKNGVAFFVLFIAPLLGMTLVQ